MPAKIYQISYFNKVYSNYRYWEGCNSPPPPKKNESMTCWSLQEGPKNEEFVRISASLFKFLLTIHKREQIKR